MSRNPRPRVSRVNKDKLNLLQSVNRTREKVIRTLKGEIGKQRTRKGRRKPYKMPMVLRTLPRRNYCELSPYPEREYPQIDSIPSTTDFATPSIYCCYGTKTKKLIIKRTPIPKPMPAPVKPRRSKRNHLPRFNSVYTKLHKLRKKKGNKGKIRLVIRKYKYLEYLKNIQWECDLYCRRIKRYYRTIKSFWRKCLRDLITFHHPKLAMSIVFLNIKVPCQRHFINNFLFYALNLKRMYQETGSFDFVKHGISVARDNFGIPNIMCAFSTIAFEATLSRGGVNTSKKLKLNINNFQIVVQMNREIGPVYKCGFRKINDDTVMVRIEMEKVLEASDTIEVQSTDKVPEDNPKVYKDSSKHEDIPIEEIQNIYKNTQCIDKVLESSRWVTNEEVVKTNDSQAMMSTNKNLIDNYVEIYTDDIMQNEIGVANYVEISTDDTMQNEKCIDNNVEISMDEAIEKENENGFDHYWETNPWIEKEVIVESNDNQALISSDVTTHNDLEINPQMTSEIFDENNDNELVSTDDTENNITYNESSADDYLERNPLTMNEEVDETNENQATDCTDLSNASIIQNESSANDYLERNPCTMNEEIDETNENQAMDCTDDLSNASVIENESSADDYLERNPWTMNEEMDETNDNQATKCTDDLSNASVIQRISDQNKQKIFDELSASNVINCHSEFLNTNSGEVNKVEKSKVISLSDLCVKVFKKQGYGDIHVKKSNNIRRDIDFQMNRICRTSAKIHFKAKHSVQKVLIYDVSMTINAKSVRFSASSRPSDRRSRIVLNGSTNQFQYVTLIDNVGNRRSDSNVIRDGNNEDSNTPLDYSVESRRDRMSNEANNSRPIITNVTQIITGPPVSTRRSSNNNCPIVRNRCQIVADPIVSTRRSSNNSRTIIANVSQIITDPIVSTRQSSNTNGSQIIVSNVSQTITDPIVSARQSLKNSHPTVTNGSQIITDPIVSTSRSSTTSQNKPIKRSINQRTPVRGPRELARTVKSSRIEMSSLNVTLDTSWAIEPGKKQLLLEHIYYRHKHNFRYPLYCDQWYDTEYTLGYRTLHRPSAQYFCAEHKTRTLYFYNYKTLKKTQTKIKLSECFQSVRVQHTVSNIYFAKNHLVIRRRRMYNRFDQPYEYSKHNVISLIPLNPYQMECFPNVDEHFSRYVQYPFDIPFNVPEEQFRYHINTIMDILLKVLTSCPHPLSDLIPYNRSQQIDAFGHRIELHPFFLPQLMPTQHQQLRTEGLQRMQIQYNPAQAELSLQHRLNFFPHQHIFEQLLPPQPRPAPVQQNIGQAEPMFNISNLPIVQQPQQHPQTSQLPIPDTPHVPINLTAFPGNTVPSLPTSPQRDIPVLPELQLPNLIPPQLSLEQLQVFSSFPVPSLSPTPNNFPIHGRESMPEQTSNTSRRYTLPEETLQDPVSSLPQEELNKQQLVCSLPQEITNRHQTVSSLSQELKNIEQTDASLQQEVLNRQEIVSSLSQEVKNIKQTDSSLQQGVLNKQQDSSLTQEVTNRNQAVSSLSQELKNIEQTDASLQQEVVNRQEIVSSLSQEVKNIEQTDSSLQQEVLNKQQDSSLIQEVTNRNQAVSSLSQELKNIEQTDSSLQQKVLNKQQESSLIQEVTNRHQTVSSLSQELKNIEQTDSSLTQEVTNRNQAVSSLSQEVNNIEQADSSLQQGVLNIQKPVSPLPNEFINGQKPYSLTQEISAINRQQSVSSLPLEKVIEYEPDSPMPLEMLQQEEEYSDTLAKQQVSKVVSQEVVPDKVSTVQEQQPVQTLSSEQLISAKEDIESVSNPSVDNTVMENLQKENLSPDVIFVPKVYDEPIEIIDLENLPANEQQTKVENTRKRGNLIDITKHENKRPRVMTNDVTGALSPELKKEVISSLPKSETKVTLHIDNDTAYGINLSLKLDPEKMKKIMEVLVGEMNNSTIPLVDMKKCETEIYEIIDLSSDDEEFMSSDDRNNDNWCILSNNDDLMDMINTMVNDTISNKMNIKLMKSFMVIFLTCHDTARYRELLKLRMDVYNYYLYLENKMHNIQQILDGNLSPSSYNSMYKDIDTIVDVESHKLSVKVQECGGYMHIHIADNLFRKILRNPGNSISKRFLANYYNIHYFLNNFLNDGCLFTECLAMFFKIIYEYSKHLIPRVLKKNHDFLGTKEEVLEIIKICECSYLPHILCDFYEFLAVYNINKQIHLASFYTFSRMLEEVSLHNYYYAFYQLTKKYAGK